ncbi:MAG: hypothetical protein HXY53_06970 [Nitrospirae bacterium]|nr:hypothetical protein [Nitrospirota bacterium]
MKTTEERIDKLEITLQEFIKSVGIEFNKLYNSQMRTEAELRDFKDEMKDFKNEMKDFKNEMKDFKNEMKDFKEEMKAFKEEMRQDRKDMNKKWGEISNKLGTLVEDIISPASRPVIENYFNCEPVFKSDNILKKIDGKYYEIDVLLTCKDKVFMIEVKSSPKIEHVDKFIEKSKDFFAFFPEYKGKKLILILASLTFPENVIEYASKLSTYVMAYREWEYMDILNFDKIKKN